MQKLLILLSLLLIASTAFAEKLTRDSSKECAICHYEWMPEFIFDLKGTDIVEYQSEKVVASEKMCFSCHNGTVGDSRIRIWSGDMHKIKDSIPEHMQIPEKLPLDNGKINCRTCHSAHATGDPKAEGVERSVFLRMENNDSQLCEACHTDFSKGVHKSHPLKKPERNYTSIEKKLHTLGAKLGENGQIVCQSCHTPHSPREKKLLIYNLDDSKLCSVCHDDKVNPQNAIYLKGMLNHPIDIKHDNPATAAQVRQKGGVYGKDDQVICLTCHTAHKGETETLLIEKNGKNGLCITCHARQKSVIGGKHDMRKVEGFRTKDGKSAQEKGICQSCHAPHGWSLNLPETDADMLSKGCLSCHREKGSAGKKLLLPERFNHPVGKKVKADMEAGALPLFDDTTEYVKKIRAKASAEANAKTNAKNRPEKLVTCATCHDTHSKNENFLREKVESGRLCTQCHHDKKMIEKTVHGREKLKKGCLDCHRIHNSDNQRLLQVGENDGCLACHKKGGGAEKLVVDPTHSHPVNMPVKHELKEDFKITPEGFFTCATCHDPHTPSKRAKIQTDFLRGGYAETDALCLACHENQKEIIGSDHDIRKKETDGVCGQCHSVHNAKTAGNIMRMEYDYKKRDDHCRACHNENGPADKKVIVDGHKTGKIDQKEKYAKHLTENNGEFFLYCSTCHTVHNNGPKRGEEGTTKNSFLNRSISTKGNFCLGCHEDKSVLKASMHNVNKFEKNTKTTEARKAEGDTCGVCHKVHNSGYYLFEKSLGQDFEEICTSCHTKNGLASTTGISTSHKMNMQPRNKVSVYLQKGKIVCATCHEPHGASKGMLRDMGGENLCTACHEDQKVVALSEHNLAEIKYLKDPVKENARKNVCFACHKPHNFHEDNRLMWAYDPQKSGLFRKKSAFALKICTDCHTQDGMGGKKVPQVLTHDNIFKILPSKVKERIQSYLFDDNGVTSMNGTITCQSCHNPHIWKNKMTGPETGVEGNARNSFLKPDVKEQFCAKCHGGKPVIELFDKFHDKNFRETRNKKQGEAEVLRNLMLIQMNLQKMEQPK